MNGSVVTVSNSSYISQNRSMKKNYKQSLTELTFASNGTSF